LRQAFFRADGLYERIPMGRGRHYHVVQPGFPFLILQDSTRHWTLHHPAASHAEMAAIFERAVGLPVRFEMLSVNKRTQRRPCGAQERRVREILGIEAGYRYAASPLIWPEDGAAPDADSSRYVPLVCPGARLPHVWLEDGTALHDLLGPGYTLLRLGPAPRP